MKKFKLPIYKTEESAYHFVIEQEDIMVTNFIRYFTICALTYGALWVFGIYEGVIR